MTQMRLKPTKRYFFITNYTLFPTDNTVKGDECSSQGSVVPRAHRFRGFFRGELKLTPPLQFDHWQSYDVVYRLPRHTRSMSKRKANLSITRWPWSFCVFLLPVWIYNDVCSRRSQCWYHWWHCGPLRGVQRSKLPTSQWSSFWIWSTSRLAAGCYRQGQGQARSEEEGRSCIGQFWRL